MINLQNCKLLFLPSLHLVRRYQQWISPDLLYGSLVTLLGWSLSRLAPNGLVTAPNYPDLCCLVYYSSTIVI